MFVRNFVSVIALVSAAAAAESADAQTATQPTPSSAADTAPADAEIIVTAQRRSERLVDVPISIATAAPEDLERAGATSIENLTKVTPGIYLQRASYGLSPTIRGIGSTLPASGGEQNVALYIDEIYFPTPSGNIFDLASIAGVEILKGPQGTLFGRNATGGAILLRTLDPGFDLQGRFNLSYERFNQVRTSGYVNLPLTDNIAVNAALAYRYSDGYVRDLRTGAKTVKGDSFTARGKLLLQPTDDFSLVLTAAHSELDDPTGTDFRNLRPAPLVSLLSGGPVSTNPRLSSSGVRQFLRTETDELSARAKLDLGAGTLSSFTALLRNGLEARSDLTGSYLPLDVFLNVQTRTFSQEVNFVSRPDQPFTYVVGLYYFRNRSTVPFLIQGGAPQLNSRGRNVSIAGYADGTYDFGKLSLTAGIRYSHSKRRAAAAFGVSAPSPFTRFQAENEAMWTPRLGIRYALTEQSNIYATYSKGFKGGSFDSTSPTGPGVTPEKVDAFEVGFKTASRDFTLNAAAFHYNYIDTQVQATISSPNGAIVTQLYNVPRSRIYGAEADASMRLGDNFDVRAAVAYTHSRYRDFPFAPGYVVNPADPATLGGLLFSNVSLDVSGNTMVRAPKFTASGTLRFHTPVGDGDVFEITLSPYYSSRVYFSFDNVLSQKAYATLDASATLTLNEKAKLSIFGRNLTNTRYRKGIGQNALGLENTLFAEPRTYGVSLGYSF